MLIAGMNLCTMGKAIKLPVVQVGAYKFKEGEAIFLYDTRAVVNLLNIPESVYKMYNAWMLLPGEWSRFYTSVAVAHVNRTTLRVPAPLGKDAASIERVTYDTIFDFTRKVYQCNDIEDCISQRIFDLFYTVARMNMYGEDIKHLLDEYADKW